MPFLRGYNNGTQRFGVHGSGGSGGHLQCSFVVYGSWMWWLEMRGSAVTCTYFAKLWGNYWIRCLHVPIRFCVTTNNQRFCSYDYIKKNASNKDAIFSGQFSVFLITWKSVFFYCWNSWSHNLYLKSLKFLLFFNNIFPTIIIFYGYLLLVSKNVKWAAIRCFTWQQNLSRLRSAER